VAVEAYIFQATFSNPDLKAAPNFKAFAGQTL
jgi:hypothetical protein